MKLVVDTSAIVSMLLSKKSVAWKIFGTAHEHFTLDVAFFEVTKHIVSILEQKRAGALRNC